MTTIEERDKVGVHSNTGQTIDLPSIFEPVAEEIKISEEYLVTNLIDDTVFVTELLGQIFGAGGKRLRPAMSLLCSKATQIREEKLSRLHIVLSVLTELIHAASLVHDDVIDSASVRRGKDTLNCRWNDRLAVLMGDLLFAQASMCLSRLMNPEIVGIYGQVLGELCAGEIRQMQMQYSTVVDWEGYITKSIKKTASLFAAASQSASLLNGQEDSVVGAMKQYGLNLGLSFQLVDDLLDVAGSTLELGKMAGSDLQNGVITAPALFVLERKDKVSDYLEHLIKSRAVATETGSAEALSIIREHGGVEKTAQLARQYADLSREALSELSDSKYKNALLMLVEYVIARTK